MLTVELEEDDLSKTGQYVAIGAIAMAIARANAADNGELTIAKANNRPENAQEGGRYFSENIALMQVERTINSRINTAVQCKSLTPVDAKTLAPLLPGNDYGMSVVSFAELEKWGLSQRPAFNFARKGQASEAARSINPPPASQENAHRDVCAPADGGPTTPPRSSTPYSTPHLAILNAAIAEFFEPRREVDAKKEEVVGWIKRKMTETGMADSESIAAAIFTIIKPENHDPRRRRG